MHKGIAFLALVGLACAALLVTTDQLTAKRIVHNKRIHEIRQITALVGTQPDTQPQWVGDTWQLCNEVVLIRTSTPGYGGTIFALVAHDHGRLRGLRVTAHQETPGIADFVSDPTDPWRQTLRSRTDVELAQLDAVTGATITSSALLAIVGEALSRPLAQKQCPP